MHLPASVTARTLWSFLALVLISQARAAEASPWWSQAVEDRLADAETNRVEIQKALEKTPAAHREGMAFLVENMPARDLGTLSSAFLLEDVRVTYDRWERTPWKESVPKEIFLSDVLAYACLSEAREAWRGKLRDICEPIVADCRSPGEAAHLLNQKLFPLLNVRYNTSRRRPDQSPSETMSTGVATCTGLSILLVDACRSVGVPARVVGTPMWSNMRGNHTWVEVWDDGWHFAGAAEPDPAGLDHGWFVGDAAQAKKDEPRHAIYASSFRRTETAFPLAWARRNTSVSAVNVTERYAKATATDTAQARLDVKVIQPDGKRVAADVTATDSTAPGTVLTGRSRDETADLNDFATFKVIPGRAYHIVATLGELTAKTDVIPTKAEGELVTLTLGTTTPAAPAIGAAPPLLPPISDLLAAELKQAFTDYFTADESKRADWKFALELEGVLQTKEPAVRKLAWEAFREAPIHASLRADFDAKIVNAGNYQSPYTVKAVGDRPKDGWALFIAMHGGGGAPKRVNDQQWRHMQIYYKDHPEAGGYLYVALRAPNDEWNGFYADYVYPLIDNLIRQFRLFGDIDPDKVFIMGYSHGGYGAYAIGPKMPDRFAAIHASAAAPTDGETTAKTLRTTPFTAMVGEKDTMYGRHERNVRFKQEVEQLQAGRADIYPVTVTIIPNQGHGGLPDRDKIPDMYPAVRNPVPTELDWLMTDGVIQDFFWVHVPEPSKGQEIGATLQGNRFTITANESVGAATVFMDRRMVDFGKPVEIELNGVCVTRSLKPSLRTLGETLLRRGNPAYAFTAEFKIGKEPSSGQLRVVASDKASQSTAGTQWKFPCPEASIARHTAWRAAEPINVDGKLDEAAWREAPVSPRFVDILTGGPVIHDTRAAVVWDDQYLYVSYRVEEPFVQAKFTNHNDPIYYDNDVECFIAGQDAYYEFEINAFNTCYEVFFAWQDTYESSGLSKSPEFERSKLVPFNGVGFTTHPRGGRLGNFKHALPGLKTAVHVDGTINDNTDRDRGWSVELAFPWSRRSGPTSGESSIQQWRGRLGLRRSCS
ncbi:MAG: transglutaminase domain-containing protein [Verrucomicrobiia bacterium]